MNSILALIQSLINTRWHLTFLPIIIILIVILFNFYVESSLLNKLLRAYPIIRDPNLKVEIVAEGITFPTSLAFLANDDILVLEKNTGAVKRVINGIIQSILLLDFDVANQGERGALRHCNYQEQ